MRTGNTILIVGCPPKAIPNLRESGTTSDGRQIVWWDNVATNDTVEWPDDTVMVCLSSDLSPGFKRSFHDEALRRGKSKACLEFNEPADLLRLFSDNGHQPPTQTALPAPEPPRQDSDMALLGVDLSRLPPSIAADRRFTILSVSDTARLQALPTGARLICMATRGSRDSTVRKIAEWCQTAGIRFVEVGATQELKKWLESANLAELDTSTPKPAFAAEEIPSEIQTAGKGEAPMRRTEGKPSMISLVEENLASTGGDTAKLLAIVRKHHPHASTQTIYCAKNVIKKRGGKPGAGAVRQERPVSRVTKPVAQKRGRKSNPLKPLIALAKQLVASIPALEALNQEVAEARRMAKQQARMAKKVARTQKVLAALLR